MRLILGAAVAVFATAALLLAQGQSQPTFVFGKADLKLLEECEALDRQFEKRALVCHDAALEKHLTDIATPMLPAAPLEHVQWKFRVLRNPMVAAFASRHSDRSEPSCGMMRGLNSGFDSKPSWLIVR